MRELKGFIFDLDGTVANTSNVIYQAYQLALRPWGKVLSKLEIESIREKKAEDLFEDWGLTKEENLSVVEGMNEYCKNNLHLVDIFEGMEEIFRLLKDKNIPLSVWTGRTQNAAIDVLKWHQLVDLFGPIYGSNNVSISKPHPEGIYKIANLWNISPSNLVMIGDHDHDIIAGKQAGCTTIRAAWREINPTHKQHHTADFTFYTPSELKNWIIEKL